MDSANYLQRAQACISLGRNQEALELLHQALVLDPESGRVYAMIALCHSALDSLDAAEEAAQRALGLSPMDDFVFHVHARVLAQRGKLVEARKSILAALSMDPADPDHWEIRGRIEWLQNQPDACLDSARKGLSFDPAHEGCLDILARVLLELDRLEEAEVVVRDALAQDPADPDFIVRYGMLLLKQGEPERAREAFSDALTIRPGMDEARVGLAESLRARNPLYRWMLPGLLRARPWFEDSPVISRLIALMGWGVCLGVAVKWPEGWMFTVPALVILGLGVGLLVFAEPILNGILFLNQKDRHALSIGQRFGVYIGWLSLIWMIGLVVWLFGHGLHHRFSLSVFALHALVVPLALVFADRFDEYQRKRLLWMLVGLCLVWLLVVVAIQMGGLSTAGPRFLVAMIQLMCGWVIPIELLKRGPFS